MDESELHFGPFRLEDAKQLWRGDQPIHLRRQTLSLLRHLAERPDRLVTKDELINELWPGIDVSPTVVKVCVREIRHALGDEAVNPQFVETVGGQGYRFIQRGVSRRFPVANTQKAGGNDQPPAAPPKRLPTNGGRLTAHLVKTLGSCKPA